MGNLRLRLQEITETASVPEHPSLIEELRKEVPHTIKMLNSPSDYLRYNCFMYALNLAADEEFEDLVLNLDPDIHPNKKFMRFLLQSNYLVKRESAVEGSIIVYFDIDHDTDRGSPVHAGLLRFNCRVDSKWGIGLLYDHQIWEVPMTYGKTVQFFCPLERDKSVQYFQEFIETVEGVNVTS